MKQESSVVYIQPGTVRGQSGSQVSGHGTGQIPSQAGSTHEHDLRLEFAHKMTNSLIVWLGAIVTKDGSINQIDFRRTIGKGFLAQLFHAIADNHGTQLDPQGLAQNGPGTQ